MKGAVNNFGSVLINMAEFIVQTLVLLTSTTIYFASFIFSGNLFVARQLYKGANSAQDCCNFPISTIRLVLPGFSLWNCICMTSGMSY